ncbi:hypothetical protein [Clostridium polynesiense]|uniref:hypothetical protein n=1 Tax=Clostridium polynesiense TaxID=1325933 RepID=UPI0005912B0E|nr:hypothetical protein [Clostridium polynesiense]
MGFSSKRSKDIKNNERLRFTPWDGDKPGGEMHIALKENKIILDRSFGSTKKEDKISAYEALTGSSVDYLCDYSPGSLLLDLTEQDYEKTLNIKQLNTIITKSKEDELIQKISNLQETGEENISYDSALNTLQNAKKLITNSRKNGELNIYENKLSKLYEDYNRSLKLSEENIESQIKLNELIEKRRDFQKELKKLELYKKHMKKMKLYKEYKELTEYLMKSEKLKEEKRQAEQGLNLQEGVIDDLFIGSLKEDYTLCIQFKDLLNERQEELKAIKEVYEENRLKINKDYRRFGELPEDIESRIMDFNSEFSSITSRIKTYEEAQREIQSLQEELQRYKKSLGILINLEDVKEECDLLLKNYEEKLIELKAKAETLSSSIKPEKAKAVSRKLMFSNIILAAGIIITAAGALDMLGFKGNILKYTALIAGAAMISYSIIIKNKHQYIKDRVKNSENKKAEIDILEKQIKNLEDRINKIAERINVRDYGDFIKGLRYYEEIKKKIDIITIKIEDRLTNLDRVKYEELIMEQEEKKRYIEVILELSEKTSINEFLLSYKDYKDLNMEIKLLKREVINHENSINSLSEEFKSREDTLRKRLLSIGIEYISIDRVPSEIERISHKLQKLNEVEGELKAINNTYKALLKDRDIESLKNEIGELSLENFSYEFNNEEEIDEAIKNYNKENLQVEKNIKDLENFLGNIFYKVSPVWIIEEEIENTKEHIKSLEKRLKVIETAIETLSESFKEIQKSFAPLLNKEVSSIFKVITHNKYNEIKVSEEYSLVLRDIEENTLFNAEYLSSGTFEQIYLSLRIAMINLIFKDKRVPIILDDAFVQYDDERLNNALKVIVELSRHKQIILFSCQKREEEFLRNIEGLNIIQL